MFCHRNAVSIQSEFVAFLEDDQQTQKLRDSLMRYGHPRFRKVFTMARGVPYGDSAEFRKAVQNADLPKLARLVKIVGMLLQSKVYLFWRKP